MPINTTVRRFLTVALVAGAVSSGSFISATSASAEATTTVDVLKVVDGQYIVETIQVPASDVAETVDELDEAVNVIGASAQVMYAPQGTTDPYWDINGPSVMSHAPDVWDRTTGEGQVVAVLDTAIDTTHPDLAGAFVPGYDAIGGTGDNSHGTGVAGIIAARADNGLGGAGIAPASRIMPIRVCNSTGCPSGSMSKGILWAVDHGADVINMSVAGTGYSDVTAAAIRYALDKNVTVVASTGNNGDSGNPVMYPAANSGVIAVSATNPTGAPVTWAVRGWQTDIATVGEDVLMTSPNGTYSNGAGTSFSSPAVAGAVALVRSAHPELSPEDVQAALQAGADSSGNWNRFWGAGRLDVTGALAAADRTAAGVTVTPAAQAVTINWNSVSGASDYTVRVDGINKGTVTGTSALINNLGNGNQVAVDVQPNNGTRSQAVLATVGTSAPGTPTIRSAALRGTSTSAIIDLTASVDGTVASRYAIIKDGVSMGTMTMALTSTPKTFSVSIGAMPTKESHWQLRGVDDLGRTSADSNSVTVGTGKPAAPVAVTDLKATVDGDKVLLTWAERTETMGFNVTVNGQVVATARSAGAVVPVPPANEKRTYQVAAVDVWGQSSAPVSVDVLIETKPVVVTAPTIQGELLVGQVLTVTDSFTGANTVTRTWKACGTDGVCAVVGTGDSYTLTDAEEGKQIIVQVVASNRLGSVTTQSEKSVAVIKPAPTKPVMTVAPSIQGIPAQLKPWLTLRTPDAFEGATHGVAHNWKRCNVTTGTCTRVAGGTTYQTTMADVGYQLVVEAVAKSAAGTVSAESPKSPVVVSNVTPPVLLVAPAIQGASAQLKPWTILRTPDSFYNATHGVAHNWKRCNVQTGVCTRVAGGVTYQTTMADVGYQLVVEAVAKNYVGSVTHTSAKSPVVVSNVTPPVLLVAPAVQGTATVGSIVKTPDSYYNADHGVTHNWKRCDVETGTCVRIAGGTTYQIVAADVGYQIVVEVIGKNYVGTSQAVSPKSAVVTR